MGRVVTNPTGSVVDASEVKILYESNENTNAYTDGDKASLDEVKDAIDMAKKVIEITFLLNNWTSNSDGTYSQTVNNSEIKSSMNPDLVSMLSSGATPEEQKTYMKNFSILCQGAGSTANGSVTYKIYKQMTADITVGLTRLGGVRQIESGGLVDDVKVGGVSVVKDKVAEIPEIPTKLDFVPYKNAQRDIELGDKILSAGISITEDGVTTGYNTSLYPQSISVGAAIKKSGEFFPSDKKNVELKPDGMVFTGSTPNSSSITVTPEYSKDEDFDHLAFIVKNYSLQQGFAKLKVGEPTEDSHAATKKYVDTKIAEVPSVDTSNLVPYTGATKDIDLGDHAVNLNTSGSIGSLSGTAIINIGKFTGGTGSIPGVYIETDAQNAGSSLSDNLILRVDPTGISVDANHEGDTGGSNTVYSVGSDGLSIQSGLDTKLKITADKVTGLALPTGGKDAASKQYVDESISAIPETDISGLVPYTGATKRVDLGNNRINAGLFVAYSPNQTNATAFGHGTISTEKDDLSIFKIDNSAFIPVNVGEPTKDTHAATKKYVDNKISSINGKETKTVTVSKTFTNVTPATTWSKFDFASGDFMGIPFSDFLGYNIWAQYQSDQMLTNISTAAEVRSAPLKASNGNFAGIRVLHKNTETSAGTYSIFAVITYRK